LVISWRNVFDFYGFHISSGKSGNDPIKHIYLPTVASKRGTPEWRLAWSPDLLTDTRTDMYRNGLGPDGSPTVQRDGYRDGRVRR
jgi:hypothetical protein